MSVAIADIIAAVAHQGAKLVITLDIEGRVDSELYRRVREHRCDIVHFLTDVRSPEAIANDVAAAIDEHINRPRPGHPRRRGIQGIPDCLRNVQQTQANQER